MQRASVSVNIHPIVFIQIARQARIIYMRMFISPSRLSLVRVVCPSSESNFDSTRSHGRVLRQKDGATFW